jgi:hypothetical protein
VVCAAALVEAAGLSDEESGEEEEEEEAVGGESGFVSMGLFLVNSWHSVEARCRERLAKTERRLARVRSRLREQQQRYQLFSPGDASAPAAGGVLERLAFLGGSALVSLELRTDSEAGPDIDTAPNLDARPDSDAGPDPDATESGASGLNVDHGWFSPWPSDELAAAEWNGVLAQGEQPVWVGQLALGADDGESVALAGDAPGTLGRLPRGAIVLCAAPADGDYCSLAWRASSAGAAALLVAAPTSIATPMAYASTARAPAIPAAMLPAAAAARVAALLREHRNGGDNGGDGGAAGTNKGGGGSGSGMQARVRVLRSDLSEDYQGCARRAYAGADHLSACLPVAGCEDASCRTSLLWSPSSQVDGRGGCP